MLTWQQTAPTTTYALADAKTTCAALSASLGGANWRVPTIKELLPLVDYSTASAPFLGLNGFSDLPSSYCWSSSRLVRSTTDAWAVSFTPGSTCSYGATSLFSVRCTR